MTNRSLRRAIVAAAAATGCLAFTTTTGVVQSADTSAPPTTAAAPSADPFTISADEVVAQESDLAGKIQTLLGKYPTVEGSTTRGVTADKVTIGVVADETYNGNPLFVGFCSGAKARLARAATEKSTKHAVELAGCTDAAGDPARSATAIEDYVKGKKVFALLTQTVPPPGNTVIADEHVPTFGLGINPLYCGTKATFGFGVTGAAVCNAVAAETGGKSSLSNSLVTAAYMRASKAKATDTKLAIIGFDAPGSADAVAQEAAAATAMGLSVVYAKAAIPPQTTDFQPFVTEMLAAKPTAVLDMAFPFSIEPTLRQAGYSGDIYQTLFVDATPFQQPTLVDVIDKVYGISPGNGLPLFGEPIWATVTADAKASAYDGPINGAFINGYASADMFLAALKAQEASGAELTAESLTNLLNAGWRYPGIEGVTAAVSFPLGHYVGSACAAAVQFDSASKSVKPASPLLCGKVFLSQGS